MKLQEDCTVGIMKMEEPALTPAVPMACQHSLQSDRHQHKSSYSLVPFIHPELKGCHDLQADGNPTDQQSLLTASVSEQGRQCDDCKKDENNTPGSSKVRDILNCNDMEHSLRSQGESRTWIRENTIAVMEKQVGVDDQEPLEENCGLERLKRHRVEVAGRVWIPEIWGQEELLKDWIDCTAFDSYLAPQGIMSARAALVKEGRRANSGELRVHDRF